ncbi:MAG TPA: hypothetical protein VIK45_07915 [Candidatus Dormibacteraeota bacterium]|jgi:hypothetical protein
MSATNGVSRRVDSPLTCEYDGDPRRPECEHIAVVAYGPIALCASCNLRRSTVGKGISPRWLEPPAPQREALLIVESARQQLGQAEARLTAAVAAARSLGCSWSHLGGALATSRQAAQQRFGSALKGGDR